jgi:hypothetical protein
MSAALQQTRLRKEYGDITAKPVSIFQKERQLQDTVILNEAIPKELIPVLTPAEQTKKVSPVTTRGI